MNEADPAKLRAAAPLLARSLAIKVDEKCLQRIPELQAPCLMQDQDSLVLNDGHSTSIVEALTNGAASDLTMAASYTPQLRYGYYSPYIASILDIGRILGSFLTAQISVPAGAAQRPRRAPDPDAQRAALVSRSQIQCWSPRLPAIEEAQLPPLHAGGSAGHSSARARARAGAAR